MTEVTLPMFFKCNKLVICVESLFVQESLGKFPLESDQSTLSAVSPPVPSADVFGRVRLY